MLLTRRDFCRPSTAGRDTGDGFLSHLFFLWISGFACVYINMKNITTFELEE